MLHNSEKILKKSFTLPRSYQRPVALILLSKKRKKRKSDIKQRLILLPAYRGVAENVSRCKWFISSKKATLFFFPAFFYCCIIAAVQQEDIFKMFFFFRMLFFFVMGAVFSCYYFFKLPLLISIDRHFQKNNNINSRYKNENVTQQFPLEFFFFFRILKTVTWRWARSSKKKNK